LKCLLSFSRYPLQSVRLNRYGTLEYLNAFWFRPGCGDKHGNTYVLSGAGAIVDARGWTQKFRILCIRPIGSVGNSNRHWTLLLKLSINLTSTAMSTQTHRSQKGHKLN